MGLDLRLSVEESGEAKPDEPHGAARWYAARVQLHPHWIRYPDIDSECDVILDFVRQRRLQVDDKAQTFLDESIFPEIAFRHFELPNREFVRSVLEAGRADPADTTDLDPVVSEHKLSVLGDTRKTTLADSASSVRNGEAGRLRAGPPGRRRADIAVDVTDGQVVYDSACGRRLLSHSTDGTDVAPDACRPFVQFLRHAFGGHPLILERIAAAGRIPREIRYSARLLKGAHADEVALRVDAIETAPESEISLEHHRRVLRVPGVVAIGPALERAILGELPDAEEVAKQRRAEGLLALEGGRNLESVLTLMELGLQTADPVPGLGDVLGRESDVTVRRLLDVLSEPAGGSFDARAAVATLVQLREAAGPRRHVLMSFESSHRERLGETKAAAELLSKALAVNPFLTVVYNDLGDLFLRQRDMKSAWLCWEAARRIAPRHPALESVYELEAKLALDHGEYL